MVYINIWNNFCKCQLEPGSFTDVPLLVRTSSLLNTIMPVVSDPLRSLFNRYKQTELTKKVKIQSSRDSALKNDNNFFLSHN